MNSATGEPSALSKVSMLVFKGSREVWGEIRGVAAQMRDRRYWPVTPVLPTKPMGVLRGPRDD